MEELKRSIIFTVTNDLSFDQRMIRICTTLQHAGFDVTLTGRRLPGSLPLTQLTFNQHRLTCIFNNGFLFYAEFNLRLFFYLLFHRADIHGAADTDTIIACSVSALIRSRKLTYDAHEYFTGVPELVNKPLVRAFWKLTERMFIPIASLHYTVSEGLAKRFTEEFKQSFHVLRNLPIAAKKTITEAKPTVFTFIYQGDLNPGRGLEETIDGIKELDAMLWIAGDGPLRKALEERVQRNGIAHKVTFHGYMNREQLATLTARAHAGLNLLGDQSISYYHSLSNKFFNYIQAGIPQICADFPEYRRINEQYQVALLCSLSTAQFVDCAKQLMTDNSLYTNLSSQCLLAARELTWENESTQLIQWYREL